jgi:hypothetical protein
VGVLSKDIGATFIKGKRGAQRSWLDLSDFGCFSKKYQDILALCKLDGDARRLPVDIRVSGGG